MLVRGLHKSFYSLSPFIVNSFSIEGSNPKDKDDYLTKSLRENSKELASKISNLQSDFQVFYEFFQFWKALFSEKVDRGLKFLFDLEAIFGEDVWEYQRKLSDYSMLSLMKNEADIEREKKELIDLEQKLSKKSNVLANGLDKFVSDMSKEVFDSLYAKDKNTKNRLFNLEVENSNDGDQMIILTENGFEYRSYKKLLFRKDLLDLKKGRKN